ncbi:SOS response-associated peptidase family protein [Rhodoferax sp.]|uniref:SOS response-associated peptidase n=1 Tax=Rhodoferax sp. TaxID=50421 RepID=UPI00344D1243
MGTKDLDTIERMCSHYQAIKDQDRYQRYFGVQAPADPGKHDLWPGYAGGFIRQHPQGNVADEAVPEHEALIGLFGLVPHWSPDTMITRHTYNARSETVAVKPSFRDAWKRSQHCIIPAEAIYEPDWRSGKGLPTRIARADGEPMGLAGLWSAWKSPKGELVHSYTMLTINAEHHPLMRQFHKPVDEKCMVVILPNNRYQDWLLARPEVSMDFMRPMAAEMLLAVAPPTY